MSNVGQNDAGANDYSSNYGDSQICGYGGAIRGEP